MNVSSQVGRCKWS